MLVYQRVTRYAYIIMFNQQLVVISQTKLVIQPAQVLERSPNMDRDFELRHMGFSGSLTSKHGD
jgi:hypothetical protein